MPKSGSERTKDWRDALIAQGYRQKAVLLSPDALNALERIKASEALSDAEAITAALLAEAARIKKGKR